MKKLCNVVLEFISWGTGRAIWYDLAARIAAKSGDHRSAAEMRSAAVRERSLRRK